MKCRLYASEARMMRWFAALACLSAVMLASAAFAQDEETEASASPQAAASEAAEESKPDEAKPDESANDGAEPAPSPPELIDLLPEDWPAAKPNAPAKKPPAQEESQPDSPAEAAAPRGKSPSDGRLPWEKPLNAPETPVLRPFDGPLEILDKFGIGSSQMEGFFNGQPWTPSEEETLIRILYRFPRFGLDNLKRWRKKDVTWDQVVAAPWNYRGQIFLLKGQATNVSQVKLSDEDADRFEYRGYYRVEIKLPDEVFPVVVFARQAPREWPLDTPIDEPVSVDAMFLKLGEDTDGFTPLLFAAGRVAWHPNREDQKLGLGPDQLKLTKLGFDWSLIDDEFRKANGKPFGDVDREAFYQLLDIVGREDPRNLIKPGTEPLDVVTLLAKPTERHGDVVLVKGIARRIIKVLVDDRDIRARYGIDHYYEIDMFLPLGKTSVRMGKDPTGEENPVYNNAFPATLIVRELPPGVTEGENLYEQLETPAVFFRVWSYRSNYTEKFKKLQPAPMFIAFEPESYNEIRPANPLTDVLVGGALGTSVLILIAVLWWFQRSDRRHRAATSDVLPTPGSEPAEPPDFSKLDVNDGPDFDNLK